MAGEYGKGITLWEAMKMVNGKDLPLYVVPSHYKGAFFMENLKKQVFLKDEWRF